MFICYNSESPELILEHQSESFRDLKWRSNTPGIDFISNTNMREVWFRYPAHDFKIVVESLIGNEGCYSSDSIQFILQESSDDIFDKTYCGLVLIKNYYQIKNLPPNVRDLGNGFYYFEGPAKLDYRFKDENGRDCDFTMPGGYSHPGPKAVFLDDKLVLDECGPFLLAHHQKGFCYDWYKITKDGAKIHELIQGENNSWLKSPDLDNYEYVAIGRDCNANCDSIQISTRANEGYKVVPCYEGENAALKIYPNPNTGSFFLNAVGLSSGEYSMRVYDTFGKIVATQILNINGYSEDIYLSLEGIKEGLYFLKINTDDIDLTAKIIILN